MTTWVQNGRAYTRPAHVQVARIRRKGLPLCLGWRKPADREFHEPGFGYLFADFPRIRRLHKSPRFSANFRNTCADKYHTSPCTLSHPPPLILQVAGSVRGRRRTTQQTYASTNNSGIWIILIFILLNNNNDSYNMTKAGYATNNTNHRFTTSK